MLLSEEVVTEIKSRYRRKKIFTVLAICSLGTTLILDYFMTKDLLEERQRKPLLRKSTRLRL